MLVYCSIGEEGERVREVGRGRGGRRERERGGGSERGGPIHLYYSATSIIRTSFIWHLDYPDSLKYASTVALEVTRHSSHCHVKSNVTPVVVTTSQTSLQSLSRQVKRHSSVCHVKSNE